MNELTKDDLLAVAKRDALERGGVDDWSWYADSLDDYDYTSSGNEVVDAHNWLQALENSGVDNWEWYDESLTGLGEYESYLNGLDDLSSALSFGQWSHERDRAERDAAAADAVGDVTTEGDDETTDAESNATPVPETESEKLLHSFIVSKFGAERADDVYAEVKDDGVVFKSNTFPREFDVALRVIQKGVTNPIDKAGVKLLEQIIANGKLNDLLNKYDH